MFLFPLSHTQQGAEGGEVIEAADPPEDVEKRVKELVRLNGIRALCRLLSLKGLSFLAQEQVLTALVQIATVPEVRGRLIQEGGYNACLSLAKEGASSMEATRIKALHALAKVILNICKVILFFLSAIRKLITSESNAFIPSPS